MAVVTATYTSPLSATLDKSTGGVVDEAMTDALAGNDLATHGTLGFIGCRASLSSAQSVANTTEVVLQLAAEAFDSDPSGLMHDLVTNNSRVFCRTAGVHRAAGFAEFAANSTGTRKALIRLNGTTIIGGDSRLTCTEGGQSTYVNASGDYLFAAGDYVELYVYQASGGALNVSTAALSLVKA